MRLNGSGIVALVLLLPALAGRAVASVDLADYLWRHRVLLVFAPSDQAQGVQTVRQAVHRRKAAILDRDMRVFFVFKGTGSELDGKPLGEDDTAYLRRRFSIRKAERAIVLVGKDGGEKLRAPLHEDLSTVFRVVDGMPMRKDEIEEKRRLGRPVTSP